MANYQSIPTPPAVHRLTADEKKTFRSLNNGNMCPDRHGNNTKAAADYLSKLAIQYKAIIVVPQ